jgi:hypothetical protein
MVSSISLIIVLLFGILVAAVCLRGLLAPERMMKFTRGVWDQDIGMTLAVFGVGFGALLIYGAM